MTLSNGNIFLRNWPFVREIHRSPVNSPHKGQWRGALMFSLICAWINARVNNREAGDLRRYRPYYDVTIMHTLDQSLCSLGTEDRIIRECYWCPGSLSRQTISSQYIFFIPKVKIIYGHRLQALSSVLSLLKYFFVAKNMIIQQNMSVCV